MTTPELVAAVADAGGLGMLGAAGLASSLLDRLLDDLSERTRGAFGVNFLMPFLDPDAVSVAARRARVVEFFYGEPDAALVSRGRAGGALVGWQVGSLAEAIAAERAGCDFIVVQGTEAGGHVRGDTSLLPLLSRVLDAVRVPVVAAGGIATARDLAAVLAAGAGAARVGTRFVASSESGAHPAYVKALRRGLRRRHVPDGGVLRDVAGCAAPRAPFGDRGGRGCFGRDRRVLVLGRTHDPDPALLRAAAHADHLRAHRGDGALRRRVGRRRHACASGGRDRRRAGDGRRAVAPRGRR